MVMIDLVRKVDPGTYKLKITSLDEKFGPSGYPYLTLQIKILRGGTGECNGATFSDMVSLSPAARFRVVQLLDAVAAPTKGKMSSEALAGKTAWGEVDIDTSQDTPRPRVMKWLPPVEDDTDDEEEEEDDEEAQAELDLAQIPELAGALDDISLT